MEKKGMRIEVYRDRASEFRWRIIAANGRKLGDSGEGYRSRHGAMRAAYRFAGNLHWLPIEVAPSAMTPRERAERRKARAAATKEARGRKAAAKARTVRRSRRGHPADVDNAARARGDGIDVVG